MKYIHILFGVFFIHVSYAQSEEENLNNAKYYEQTGNDFYSKQQYDSAAHYQKLAAKHYYQAKNYEKAHVCYWATAFNYIEISEYDSVINLIPKAIANLQPYVPETNGFWTGIYMYLGCAYNNTDNFYLANKYYTKSLIAENSRRNSNLLTSIYLGLGSAAQKEGDFITALHYYHKRLELVMADSSYKTWNKLDAYKIIGNVYALMKQYDKAFYYFNKAIVFLEQMKKANVKDRYSQLSMAGLYVNIGMAYQDQQKYDSAIVFLNKILPFHKDNPELIANTFQNLSWVYINKKEYTQAMVYINKAIKADKDYVTFRQKGSIATNNQVLGKLYLKTGDLKKSLQYCQKSLSLSYYNKVRLDLYTNPSFDLMSAPDVLRNTMLIKTEAFHHYALQTKKQKDFDGAINTYNAYVVLMDKTRQIHEAQGSKQLLSEFAIPVIEGAVKTSLAAYNHFKDEKYKYQAYEFAQKGRAILLQESLAEMSARRNSAIPDSLKDQEYSLKSEIAYYEKELFQAEKDKKEKQITNIRGNLFELEETYKDLVKNLEENYPKYHQFKYKDTRKSLQEIQSKLAQNTALIEYYVGDSTTYIFTITSNDLSIQEVTDITNVSDLVRNLRKGLNAKAIMNDPDQAYRDYSKNAYLLYEKLLKAPLAQLPSNIEKLIIIPDGELGYVPFETLITTKADPELPDYRRLDYVMKQYPISYAYAASLLFEDFQLQKQETKGDVLAFAPSYAKTVTDTSKMNQLGKFRDAVTELLYNTKEIKSIDKVMDGGFYESTMATERNFKAEANNYKMIHLAMHALVDDENPALSKLVFTHNQDTTEDGFLHLYELYNMELNADMAVLSACNTGYGKLEKGEGIMSLARGFAYAGCPSIVMTHWQVDDKATSSLMAYFYEALAQGLPKDEALQQAKLKYLETANPITANPFFWGSAVTIGDSKAVVSNTWYYWLIGALVLALIGGFWMKRRK